MSDAFIYKQSVTCTEHFEYANKYPIIPTMYQCARPLYWLLGIVILRSIMPH